MCNFTCSTLSKGLKSCRSEPIGDRRRFTFSSHSALCWTCKAPVNSMARLKKDKNKAKDSIPNKNIHLRLAFLHQASLHLVRHRDVAPDDVVGAKTPHEADSRSMYGNDASARHLLSHMKGIGRRSVIRLQRQVKMTVCKGCDQLLVEGATSIEAVENNSKNAGKPHADVLVIQCRTCYMNKRFPIGAAHQQGKNERLRKVPTLQR